VPHDGKTARGRTYVRLTLEERFWPKVSKEGPVVRAELGPCWLWTGSILQTGYGCIRHDGKTLAAQHVSWAIAGLAAPASGLYLCHRCDVRACVNPAHLYVGTPQRNSRDAVERGRMIQQRAPERMARGSRHGQSKLDEDRVAEIRRLHAAGASTLELGRRFGVSATMVGYIVRRQFWRHVS
jgi:hypothetical protein